MKIKSALSIILIFVLLFNTAVSAKNKDSTGDSEWTKKIDEKGKPYYLNKNTNESIVQAFKYDENGEFVEVLLDDAFPMIKESFDASKEVQKAEESNKIEEEKKVDDVSISAYPYTSIVWSYAETYSSTNMGAGKKVSPDVLGPTVINYGTSTSVTESFSLSVTTGADVKNAIKAGASFGWTKSASSNASFGAGFSVDAGKIGAVYFAPYYNYTRGTLTKKTYTSTGGLQSVNTYYNQSAKSPVKVGSFADGLYYLVIK